MDDVALKETIKIRGEILKSVLRRLVITIISLITIFIIFLINPNESKKINYSAILNQNSADSFILTYNDIDAFNIKKEEERQRKMAIVYQDMTMDELIGLINRSLNSTISNKGELIATYSLEKGVDPVLATAIILHETGCRWECSYLVKACNNVGGMKGSSGCNGSYARFSSLDQGIKSFINNLDKNYYAYGLNTPEKMNSKYAESTSWAKNVNNYIKSIKKNA